MDFCTIYFVRHGQSLANINDLVGVSSSPLSQLGREQAEKLKENLSGINFSAVYSSGFERAKETAAILVGERNFEVDRRLNEWNIGKLDGVSQAEFNNKTSIYFNESIDPTKALKYRLFPAMETPQELLDRLSSFINEKSRLHLGQNILAITHGAALGFLLVSLGYLKLEQLPDFGKLIPNTNFIKIVADVKNKIFIRL